jgi:hypothetical protein
VGAIAVAATVWAATAIEEKPVMLVETQPCTVCGKRAAVEVPEAGYVKWQGGQLIQRALPTLTDDERELLMTGTHSHCWDAQFPDEFIPYLDEARKSPGFDAAFIAATAPKDDD